jgi:hypothetical protein
VTPCTGPIGCAGTRICGANGEKGACSCNDGGPVDASGRDAGADSFRDEEADATDASAEGDAPQPTSLCDDAGWCWVNAWPVGADLQALWQDAPDDVWAVGDHIILHFDGTNWASVGPPMTAGGSSVSGTSADDVWVAGPSLLHWNGTAWTETDGIVLDGGSEPLFATSVFAIDTDDVWIAGFSGVAHWDGTAWSAVRIPGTTGESFGQVWASSSSDLWVTMPSTAQIANWNGATWTFFTPVLGSGPIGLIGGTGPSNVYVGYELGVYHFDGSTWSEWFSCGVGNCAAIWGGGSDLWIVGNESGLGIASYWNGSTWSDEPTFPATSALEAVSGSGPTDVWVAGGDGVLVHWDGSTWSTDWRGGATSLIPRTPVCRSASYRNANDAWIVGNLISTSVPFASHWDGTSWTAKTISGVAVLDDIWGASPKDAYASGATDASSLKGALAHWDGSTWSTLGTSDEVGECAAIWADATDDVWACCGNGVLHWDGKSVTATSLASEVIYTGIWGASATDIYLVGDDVKHYDGTSWSTFTPPEGAAQWVSGSGPNDVWIAGQSYVTHWDGAAWSDVTTDIPGLAGEAVLGFVATDLHSAWLFHGTPAVFPTPSSLAHWDGTSWSPEPQPQEETQLRGGPGTGVLLFSNSVDECGVLHHR